MPASPQKALAPVQKRRRARARAGGAAAPHRVGAGVPELLSILLRLYLKGGAQVLTVVLFLSTGSLWSLAALLPWFLAARLMRRM